MTDKQFIEAVYEIAFGDNAINRNFTKEEVIAELKVIKKLGESLTEELCAAGKAYRKRRMAAGEKSSAYLSGRAVKVCKGQVKGPDGKKRTASGYTRKSLRIK